jgi:hypothetical protein
MTYSQGDKVVGAVSGEQYLVEAGPFNGTTGEFYVASFNGYQHFVSTRHIRPAQVTFIPGDEVKQGIVKAGPFRSHGRTLPSWYVVDGGAYDLSILADDMELVKAGSIFTWGNVQYDTSATYRDCDGDHWHFTDKTHSDGTPVMRCPGSTPAHIREVALTYGPLTKV